MTFRRTLALAGAFSAMVFAGCEHPPFAPMWDADWYMPLSTQPITLSGYVPAAPNNFVPPGASFSASFTPQQQDASGVFGDVLAHVVTDPARCTSAVNPALSCDVMTLVVTKPSGVAAQDTLFVANSQANLNAAGPGTVVFPLSIGAGSAGATDSINLTPASVTMLHTAGVDGTPLWIQLRGRVSNPGAGNLTIASTDAIRATLSVTLRVAVSH